MATDRATLLAEKQRHQKALEEAARALDELDKADASKVFEKVVALLEQSGKHFTTVQRNQIVRLVKPDGVAKGTAKGEKEPLYQLDTGETWQGRGKTTAALKAWGESAAGKKWRKENPGKDYPAYPNPKAPKTV